MKKLEELCRGGLIGIIFALLLFNFRWITLPLLPIAIALWWGSPAGRRLALGWVAWSFVALSLVSPIDVNPFGTKSHHGELGKGIRLVPLVYGMPMHTRLIAKYGEYYSGGCCVPLFPAEWILTWD